MDKFTIKPESTGYSFTDNPEVFSTSLKGGLSKYRTDLLDSSLTINMQWILDRLEYNYIRDFYKNNKAEIFLLDLLIDDAFALVEKECRFKPGTFGLKLQQGYSFVVGASIETNLSPELSPTPDNVLIMLFGGRWEEYNDKFDKLMNIDIPEDYNE